MTITNYDLFVKFASSFYHDLKTWHKVFNKKLTIDVITNPYFTHIHNHLHLYTGHKRKIIFSVIYLFPDTVKEKMALTTLDTLLESNGSFDESFYKLLSLFSPYKIGKILMALKHESSMREFLNDTYNISKIFGPGGIDGLRIALDIKEKPGNFSVGNSFTELVSRLKSDTRVAKYISDDLLLIEDLLCEFHMFYRLFGEKFTDLSPEQIIECIDSNLLETVILSEYKDDETNDYDNFQKQHIVEVVFKGENENGTF